jgi:Periplasmic binding protein
LAARGGVLERIAAWETRQILVRRPARYDTYGLAAGTATELVARGAKTWAFLTADYEFGKALERHASTAVERAGGKVVASIRHPQGAHDFSSDLLRLQNSGAQVMGLTNARSDTINSVKQAQEFGLTNKGTRGAVPEPQRRPRTGAGCGAWADVGLLLEPRRWHPRLRASLLRPPACDAEPRPGRRLLRGHPPSVTIARGVHMSV